MWSTVGEGKRGANWICTFPRLMKRAGSDVRWQRRMNDRYDVVLAGERRQKASNMLHVVSLGKQTKLTDT